MNTIGNITEEMLKSICFNVLNNPLPVENVPLNDKLVDVEFWEGGSVSIEDSGEIWLSGDNGREMVSLEMILGIKSLKQ